MGTAGLIRLVCPSVDLTLSGIEVMEEEVVVVLIPRRQTSRRAAEHWSAFVHYYYPQQPHRCRYWYMPMMKRGSCPI